MVDIFHTLPIKHSPSNVFQAVATPEGLINWWPNEAIGIPAEGSEYELQFGPQYVWRAKVTKCIEFTEFEFEMTESDQDWNGTRIGFLLENATDGTLLHFHHVGWPRSNEHYKTSCYCWAMYLRCLKRYVENGVVLAYNDRFDG
jgi:uncharacterized protein YndB with AHSA1/START domain